MKTQWKCSEEKEGWRINALLLLVDGVEITSDVLIPRALMGDEAVLSSIHDMTNSINETRVHHEKVSQWPD